MRQHKLLPFALCAALAACGDDAADRGTDATSPDGADTADPDVAESADTTPVPDAVDPDALDPDGADTAPGPMFCEGTTTFAWDPDDDTQLAAFPSDALSVDDTSALTGLRVHIGAPKWLDEEPRFFLSAWRQLEALDGFGTSAGIVLRFSAPLAAPPSGSATGDEGPIVIVDLDAAAPVRIPFEVQVLDDGATLVLWPMRPLAEAHLHGVVVTRALATADGGCISPSPALRAALTADPAASPAVARLASRFARLAAAAATFDVAVADISAATVFTTQAYTVATLAQRDHLRAQRFHWKKEPTCDAGETVVTCEGEVDLFDYRIEGYMGRALEADYVPTVYTMPVHLWLPAERRGAVPFLVFGHGLAGDASQAEAIAELAAGTGLATIAIAAPRHGDHPTAESTDPQTVFTSFFGIDLQTVSIDGFVFRENVRQAAFDKLQVLELLREHPDVDGDGSDDLDMGKGAYWGISLGGILGPNFIAMSDIEAAIFSIAGARVISIVSEGADFAQFFGILAQLSGGADNLLRQAPVAQTLIDGADPVGWAPHLVGDAAQRLGRPDVPAPHLLLQMVMDDTTVPNIATRSLARAVDAPQVPAVIVPVDLLEAAPAAPVSGNRDGTTIGLFQLDRVTTSPGGNPKKATHGGVFSGIEAIDQVAVFLATWLSDAAPSIIDPYVDNGTPPL